MFTSEQLTVLQATEKSSCLTGSPVVLQSAGRSRHAARHSEELGSWTLCCMGWKCCQSQAHGQTIVFGCRILSVFYRTGSGPSNSQWKSRQLSVPLEKVNLESCVCLTGAGTELRNAETIVKKDHLKWKVFNIFNGKWTSHIVAVARILFQRWMQN